MKDTTNEKMSEKMKRWRKEFKEAVLKRDKKACVLCGWHEDVDKLDVHHITDRNDIPNYGYVPENGITLCPTCRRSAEYDLFPPEQLYKIIGSSKEKAFEAAKRLK